MDKSLYMIDLDKEDYIDYLICEKGYAKEEAEHLANIMY